MKSFDGSLELFENVGKAYIITAFCNFFGIEKVKDLPAKHIIPPSPDRHIIILILLFPIL